MSDDGTATGRAMTTLLTIGAFARTSRLSIKALRLYDEIGLLPPICIDPATGYRYYDPAQLERARLVVWLRRLDMPLARIRSVCDLCETDRYAAVVEIREFWLRVEADAVARRELVEFLVEQLSVEPGKAVTMPHTHTAEPLEIRDAALSDGGSARPSNQDAAYAGPAARSPRCCGRGRGSASCTSATRAPTCSAMTGSSRSRATTRSSSP